MRNILWTICSALFLVACDGGGTSEAIRYPEESSEALSSAIELSAESSSEVISSIIKSSSSDKSSSSEALLNSSSSTRMSSSFAGVTPCKTETEDICEYGTLVDERDGQIYKTVKIGEQIWMAENLNYAYLQPTAQLDSSSWCYGNDSVNCEKYGRLYLWSAALDSAALFGNAAKGFGNNTNCLIPELLIPCSPEGLIRGTCPAGWRLPRQEEWFSLFEILGNANQNLKSKTDWIDDIGGTDLFGLNVLPSGFAETYNKFVEFLMIGKFSDFWTPDNYGKAQPAYFSEENGFEIEGAQYAFSIRCIKDEPN